MTPATGAVWRMPGPAATNVPCMLMLMGEVDLVGQIPVLPEELAEGDQLARRRRIGLVGRTEDDDDVAAAVRMERVGAVDVAQLLLEEDASTTFLPGLAGSVRFSK